MSPFSRQGDGPWKIHQIVDNLHGAVNFPLHNIDMSHDLFICVWVADPVQKIDGVADNPKGISDVMGYTAGELADGGQLLMAKQLGLCRFKVLAHDVKGACRLSISVGPVMVTRSGRAVPANSRVAFSSREIGVARVWALFLATAYAVIIMARSMATIPYMTTLPVLLADAEATDIALRVRSASLEARIRTWSANGKVSVFMRKRATFHPSDLRMSMASFA